MTNHEQPLKLKNVKPFAEGGNRLCFVYPDDKTRCIKIVKPDSIKNLRAKRSFLKNLRPDSYFDDNLNEYKAYQQSAIIKGGDEIYDHIPRCYGWQDSDLGKGLVLDYFANPDGTPCVTLLEELQKNGLTPALENQLEELGNFLKSTQILTKNILPHNVVCASDGKLKIIDGIGAPSALSIVNFSARAKAAYIERRIERMILRMRWEVSDKSKNWKETEKFGAL